MNIAKLKNKAEGLVTQLTAKDECEKRVLDAVSNRSWAAHPTLLNEIAEDTFHIDRYSAVMRLVWKTVESAPRNWRSIAKALILIEHLIRNGAEKVVGDVQQHIHDVGALTNFRYLDGAVDRGNGVREKAREIMELLDNPQRIRAERLKARDLKSQYSGYGSSAPSRPSLGDDSTDYHASSPEHYDRGINDTYDRSGSSGGGRVSSAGRDSGEISDDWRAGYDRSPTPPSIDTRRSVGHTRISSVGSDKIDFDAGRQEYSGRLSKYQEQERREASLASSGGLRTHRNTRDSMGRYYSPEADPNSQFKGRSSKGSSKRRDEQTSTSRERQKQTGPDLLSGDDPFLVTARQTSNEFSSFSSHAPQTYQDGSERWSVGNMSQQGNAAHPGEMAPHGQNGGGSRSQHYQHQQQQTHQQQANQYSAQSGWGQQGQQVTHQVAQQIGYGHEAGQDVRQYAPQQQSQQSQQSHPYVQEHGGQFIGHFTGQGQQHVQGLSSQTYGQTPQQQHAQSQQPLQMDPQHQHVHQQYQVQPQQGYEQQHQGYQQQGYQQQQQQLQQQHGYQQQQQQPYSQGQQSYPPHQGHQQQQMQQQHQPQHQPQQLPQQHRPQQQPQQQPRKFPQDHRPQHQQQQLQQQQPQRQPQQIQQQQQPQQQRQLSPQPPPPPEPQEQTHFQVQQSPPSQAQAHSPREPEPQQATRPPQPSGPGNSQQGGTIEQDWVPTEVVRAGIEGVDLAAVVGGLRHTGFKPSDVGGKTVFSGQGQRGAPAGTTLQRVTHQPPPTAHHNVEYVEEGQDLRANTSEYLGARSTLNKTGLSSRLQEAPRQHYQQQPQPPAPQRQTPGPAAQTTSSAPADQDTPQRNANVGATGQWQGLPRSQGAAGAGQGQGQRASWQSGAGGTLRSTGLMDGSGASSGVGGRVQAANVSAHGQGNQEAATRHQGTAGLRRTGLGAEGSDGTGGLDMGRLNLNSGSSSQQQQWRT